MTEPRPDPIGRHRRSGRRPWKRLRRHRTAGTGVASSTVSAAGLDMAHRPDHVPAIAVRAAIDVGFDGAAFRVLNADPATHRSLETTGLDEDPADPSSLSAAMADLVLAGGGTVVARRDPGEGDVALPQPSVGIDSAMAGPIWIEGWIAAVLVGVMRAGSPLTPDAVAAFGLLASQAGLTLDNAQRIEEGRQAAGRLEQGERLKTEFLTTISHEMRTPLTVLMGNGLTLEHTWTDLDDASRRELLAGMNANVRILDGMLSTLLDHARLEAGELWVSFEPFDVSGMLHAICDRAEPGDRELRTEIEDDLLASGDVVLIRRIVTHLIANAATHTPPGTIITASCRRDDHDVVLRIADDGPGITEEDLPFIGERFFRSGDANARPKGLGLGLALAQGILDLHGSALVVENGPDGGARFSFSLPWVPDPSGSEHDDDASPGAYAPHHGRA